MDWRTYAMARQYLLEEFIGSRVREAKEYERRQAQTSARHIQRS
jgi:hypothetical protein